MTLLIICAVFAVALAVGGYIGVRLSNASRHLNADISRYLLVPDELDRDRWRWGQ